MTEAQSKKKSQSRKQSRTNNFVDYVNSISENKNCSNEFVNGIHQTKYEKNLVENTLFEIELCRWKQDSSEGCNEYANLETIQIDVKEKLDLKSNLTYIESYM